MARALLDRPARERLLFRLKTHGPLTAAALAKRLGITPTGVRQQLEPLLAEGLVAFTEAAGQVGRPRRLWRLTGKAQGLFPDSHADLAVGMLADARAAFGAKGVERLIAERVRRQIEDYRHRLPPKDAPLAERVAALARIRTDEGYMATSQPAASPPAAGGEGSGEGVRLVERHCPICVAAKACTGLCDGELTLFRTVLGPGVTVEREAHVLAGDDRCTYRITPRIPPRSSPRAVPRS